MNAQKSFSDYVTATRYNAVDHIMTKAKTANHLAKTLAGANKRRLYELKHGCISRALELSPESLIVDSFDMRQGVIGIQSMSNGIRLHAPAAQLTPKAKAAVLEQIARVIQRVA